MQAEHADTRSLACTAVQLLAHAEQQPAPFSRRDGKFLKRVPREVALSNTHVAEQVFSRAFERHGPFAAEARHLLAQQQQRGSSSSGSDGGGAGRMPSLLSASGDAVIISFKAALAWLRSVLYLEAGAAQQALKVSKVAAMGCYTGELWPVTAVNRRVVAKTAGASLRSGYWKVFQAAASLDRHGIARLGWQRQRPPPRALHALAGRCPCLIATSCTAYTLTHCLTLCRTHRTTETYRTRDLPLPTLHKAPAAPQTTCALRALSRAPGPLRTPPAASRTPPWASTNMQHCTCSR